MRNYVFFILCSHRKASPKKGKTTRAQWEHRANQLMLQSINRLWGCVLLTFCSQKSVQVLAIEPATGDEEDLIMQFLC